MAQLNARFLFRRTATTLLLTAIVAVACTVALAARSAGSDQISSLKAEATSISQKLVLEQLQVDAYQQQYSVYTQKVASDTAQIAAINQQIEQDQQQIDAKSTQVRHTALMTYMNAGAASSDASVSLFTGGANKAQAASEYSNIAVGNITTAIDQLHTARVVLGTDQQALQHKQSQDQSDLSQRADDLSQANNTAAQLTSTQAQVNGQLAAAIAQQQAAEQAAAAAAVAAAQHAAAARAAASSSAASGSSASAPSSTGTTSGGPAFSAAPPTTTGSASGPPPQGANLPDPALNPFLQCVVQAESGGNYGAVSPNGEYMGAFQFSQATWNSAAEAAGLPWLVGVPPNVATKAEQDTVAVTLYSMDGQQPWLGDRCGS